MFLKKHLIYVYRPPKVRPKKSNDWEVGIFMAKYSYELKKKIVNEYLNGEGSYEYLANKYGISSCSIIKTWVNNYKAFGDSALKRSRKHEKYTFEKKLYVVKLYLSSEISYKDLAIQEGITNPSMICNWVLRFRAYGPDALKSHKKGRKRTLSKHKNNNINHKPEEKIIDTRVEHIRKLEDENLKLRIENAFLKELRRLRLEDEAKMREWRESSAASEENSD
jgi:transposase